MLARPDRYRRLFSDAHAEEVRYFRTHGFYPVMHLVVLKRDLAERFPELPRELQRMFEEAKKLAYDYYADSNYSLLVDARMLYEQLYCARGEMENRIKECQLDLFAEIGAPTQLAAWGGAAPAPPPCAPTSCGCGSPLWPTCSSRRCAASASPAPSSPPPPAAASA